MFKIIVFFFLTTTNTSYAKYLTSYVLEQGMPSVSINCNTENTALSLREGLDVWGFTYNNVATGSAGEIYASMLKKIQQRFPNWAQEIFNREMAIANKIVVQDVSHNLDSGYVDTEFDKVPTDCTLAQVARFVMDPIFPQSDPRLLKVILSKIQMENISPLSQAMIKLEVVLASSRILKIYQQINPNTTRTFSPANLQFRKFVALAFSDQMMDLSYSQIKDVISHKILMKGPYYDSYYYLEDKLVFDYFDFFGAKIRAMRLISHSDAGKTFPIETSEKVCGWGIDANQKVTLKGNQYLFSYVCIEPIEWFKKTGETEIAFILEPEKKQ